MFRRELRSLAELGSIQRSSPTPEWIVVRFTLSHDRVGTEETTVPQAADAQELQEKLQMAQDDLELVRADLTRRLEQAQQAQQTAATTTASSADVRGGEGRGRGTEVEGAGGGETAG